MRSTLVGGHPLRRHRAATRSGEVRTLAPVMEPSRDWIDYVGALGSVLGAAAALVALWLARQSAKHAKDSAAEAKRTADAAEDTAKAAQEEVDISRASLELAQAERARAPWLVPELTPTLEGPTSWIVAFVLENTGTKPAERILVNVHVPRHTTVEHTRTKGILAIPSSSDSLHLSGLVQERLPGEDELREWHRFIDREFDGKVLDPYVRLQTTWAVEFPERGRHPVMIYLRYADAPKDAPKRAVVWLDTSEPQAPASDA